MRNRPRQAKSVWCSDTLYSVNLSCLVAMAICVAVIGSASICDMLKMVVVCVEITVSSC